MVDRGYGDAGCIEVEIGGQQFVYRSKNGNRIFGCGIGGSGRVRLDSGHEGNAQPRRFQFAVNAEMVLAEGAVPGHGYAQNGFVSYCAAPLSDPFPSTAFRQRL